MKKFAHSEAQFNNHSMNYVELTNMGDSVPPMPGDQESCFILVKKL